MNVSKSLTELKNNEKDFRSYNSIECILNFYANNLRFLVSKELYLSNSFYSDFNDIFFKALYLKRGYTIFIYISGDCLCADLFKLSFLNGGLQINNYNDICI